jgi:hypothetical protein
VVKETATYAVISLSERQPGRMKNPRRPESSVPWQLPPLGKRAKLPDQDLFQEQKEKERERS